MSSVKKGIEARTVNIEGPSYINQNQTKTVYSNNSFNKVTVRRNFSSDRIVGYFPDSLDHHVPEEISKSHCQSFADLNSLIHSAKQSIIVIHGPLSTGKSTLAHMLMNVQQPQFVNRIWINAESNDSLKRDIRKLYKTMRLLQNLPLDDPEDLQLLLKWLYRNLLANSTLLIFDNAAAVDLDQNSTLKDVYNLVRYLPNRSAWFVSEKMVTPSIVITTRAVFNQESTCFPLKSLKLSQSFLSLANLGKLLADFELIGRLETGALPLFIVSVVTIMAPEKVLVGLLVHLVCECPQVQILLQNKVGEDQVHKALSLLQKFSIIEIMNDEFVSMPHHACAGGATSLLESSALFNKEELMKCIIMSVSDSISSEFLNSEDTEQSKKRFVNFGMNLLEIQKRACSFNGLIRSLYPFMLEFQADVSEAYMTFSFQGNSYEAQFDQLTNVHSKYLVKTSLSSYTRDVKVSVEEKLVIVQSFLGSSVKFNSDSTDSSCPYSTMMQIFLRRGADFKAAFEEYQKSGFTPSANDSTSVFHTLCLAESQFKMGLLSEASSSLSAILGVPPGSMNHLYSASPLECFEASILTFQGKYHQARQTIEKALNDREIWRNSTIVAAWKHSLAKIEAQAGRLGQALRLINHVVSVRHYFLGVTTLRYIQAAATKAKILKLRGHDNDAYKCLSQAKADFVTKNHYLHFEGKLEDHPNCLILRYYQAKLWSDERCLDALHETEAVLDQMAVCLDETNHYRFKCRVLQAHIFKNLGEFRKSKKLLKKLVKDATNIFGDVSNPRVIKVTLAYASVLIHTGNGTKAAELARSVLDTTDLVKLRLQAQQVLAAVKLSEGHDAIPDFKEVVQESTNVLGPFNMRTLRYKEYLAEALLNSNSNEAKNIDEAHELVSAVLLHLDNRIPDFYFCNSGTDLSWNSLQALVLLKLNRITECLEALDFMKLVLPEGHSFLAKANLIEATAVAQLGDKENFAQAYEKTFNLLHWRTAGLGTTAPEPDVATLNALLAFLAMKFKGPEASSEIFSLCQSSIALIGETHDRDHFRMIRAKLNLAIAYGIYGERNKALELFETIPSAPTLAAQSDLAKVILTNKTLDSDEFRSEIMKLTARISFDRGAFVMNAADNQQL